MQKKKKNKPPKQSKKEPIRFRVLEKRKHPRFLLSGEQFRELKTGRIFPVYDLSVSGMSLKVEARFWPIDAVVKGILNLHPDSIELSVRVVDYYGDRVALKIELVSTYSRSVLFRALSAKRLGLSLKLVREKLPFADLWYHGACNTDLLLKLNSNGLPHKAEVFFSNFYWCWSDASSEVITGVCQSIGQEQREDLLLGDEPVMLESIHLSHDYTQDSMKAEWAKGILEAAPIEQSYKDYLLKKFLPS